MLRDPKEQTRQTAGIGQKLRWRRKIKGFSLQRVADRSGISIGLLSEIERGLSTPTSQTLRQICRALEMPFAWLFDDSSGADSDEGPIVRASARRQLVFAANGMSKQLMTPDSVPAIQMMRIVIRPGGGSGRLGSDAPEGAKCGTVLSGRLGLTVGDQHHELAEGDSFAFDARVPHRFRCVGETGCEILWVVTPAVY